MHDIIFCFERSGKKYYGAILSPATNFLFVFPYSSPNLLLIFSSYQLICVLFFIKLLLRCARPLSGYEFTNSLTCVTPTKILLLLNHLKILLLLNHLKTIILKHLSQLCWCAMLLKRSLNPELVSGEKSVCIAKHLHNCK